MLGMNAWTGKEMVPSTEVKIGLGDGLLTGRGMVTSEW